MDRTAWNRILYLYLAAQTWCIVLILELILLRIPYVSIFLVIFAAMLYLNRNALRSSIIKR